jgi:hypothetical protein
MYLAGKGEEAERIAAGFIRDSDFESIGVGVWERPGNGGVVWDYAARTYREPSQRQLPI